MLCGDSTHCAPEGTQFRPASSRPVADVGGRVETLADVLRNMPEHARQGGVYVMDPRGSQEFRTYTQILERALRVGAALRVQAIDRLDRILLVQSTGFDFLSAFFGAVAIGATPVPYPPAGLQGRTGRVGPSRLVRTARRLGVEAVVADTDIDPSALPSSGPGGAVELTATVPELLEDMPAGAVVEPQTSLPETAYIQLTAGTTGPMRGVELTHRNILTNVDAIGQALAVDADDIGVSWVPPYNSMGLVGLICFGLYWGLDMVLLHPRRFLKRPQDWLTAISRHRATLSTAPNFAYHYAVRRCQTSDLQGVDLSSWRVAMNGGEPVRAQHMDAFVRRFRDYGLRRDVFLPVYGLAEATVGVTVGALGAPVSIDGVNRPVLERDGRAQPLPDDGASSPAERLHLVSVGCPLEGVDVKIVDDDGREAPDRICGSICVRGPNVMNGYIDADGADGAVPRGQTRLDRPWLMTGDRGYIADGQLYVLGRLADTIATADGRSICAAEVELFVSSVDGVRAGGAVAFEAPAGSDGDTNGWVVVYEVPAGTDSDDVERAVRALLAKHLDIAPDRLVAVSIGSVPKTHTGKVRRVLARQLYLDDQLERRRRSADFDGIPRLVKQARAQVGRLRHDLYERVKRWFSS